MAFTKITSVELNSRGATKLDNKPAMAAQKLKEEFDAPAKEIIAPAYNRLIDELQSETAAASLGSAVPSELPLGTEKNVQSVLNALSQKSASAHTHANKELLDTYTQTEEDLADAVSKKHEHDNKALLDTYNQTNADIAETIEKKHEHDNKSLLDEYTQTESDLSDAVSKKHVHDNKELLDTYTQTEENLSDAVSKKHTHNNKTVIDKFSEDSSGKPLYDGNPIGEGSGGSTVEWQQNTTEGTEIAEITIDGETQKVYAPTSGGGGGSTDYSVLTSKPKINGETLEGDKSASALGLASASDITSLQNNKANKSTTLSGYGITDAVPNTRTINGKALSSNVTLAASDVSAVPTTRKVNGKALSSDITLSASDVGALPNTTTIPTVADTYSATSSNAMSGKAVAQALQNVQVTTDTNFSTTSNNPLKNKSVTKVLSDLYSSAKTYNAGDMCIYNDTLWKKIGASESGITPTEGTSWTACNIANEISAVNSNLTQCVHSGSQVGGFTALNLNEDFVCPSDGYIRMNASGGSSPVAYNVTVDVKSSAYGYATFFLLQNTTMTTALFVPKGMILKVTNLTNGASVRFWGIEK